MHSMRSGIFAFLLLLSSAAQAAEIKKFTPEGEVAQTSSVGIQFSTTMVAEGNRGAAAPVTIECPVKGQGYWASANNWIYAFEEPLPAGIRCQFNVVPNLLDLKGAQVKSRGSYQFKTGGPQVLSSMPSVASTVEEHAAFVLNLSAPVDKATVPANAYCQLAGVAEKVPLRIIEGADRDAILASQFGKRPSALQEQAKYLARLNAALVVQCAQAATAGSTLAIIWGAGIKSQSGFAQSQTRRYEYDVREAFTASMTCERENAQAACLPNRSITLAFSSPVATKLLEQIRMKAPDGMRLPSLSDEDKKNGTAEQLQFKPPFGEKAELLIEMPRDIKDGSGRTLSNASLFPLATRTANAPPLVKFAGGEFGLIERKADPVVPITLRRIEVPKGSTPSDANNAQIRLLKVDDDVQILKWVGKLRAAGFSERVADDPNDPKQKDSRKLSLLKSQTGIETLSLPKPKGEAKDGEYPFEVVGLPMAKPGFYVMEIESRKLGASLLSEAAKPASKELPTMFVKSSALVTNLAVHFRQGQENSLVWVTSLDQAKPVKDASLKLTSCNGKTLWQGKSDDQGKALVPLKYTDFVDGAECEERGTPSYMISARATSADGVGDLGFVLSDWNKGIETWRFNLRTFEADAERLRHRAVLDRNLLRAGETLSMKLYSRQEGIKGLSLPSLNKLPKALEALHVGSDDRFPITLTWKGNRHALAQWQIPKDAKLGIYDIRVAPAQGEQGKESEETETPTVSVGSVTVAEFKLPSMAGLIDVKQGASLIAPKQLPLSLQLSYLSSGPAANHNMTVSAVASRFRPEFDGFEKFSFDQFEDGSSEAGKDQEIDRNANLLIADKLQVKLDAKGQGTVTIDKLPAFKSARSITLEASYADPNGEIQTLSQQTVIWPANVMLGIRTEGWVSVGKTLKTQLIVLDTKGKPVMNQAVEIIARARDTYTTRKRLVGGFYAYDNNTQYRDLGRLCSSTTNAQGLADCSLDLKTAGNVELIAKAKDSDGNLAQSMSSVWVTERGEIWFDAENQDRIDLIPEKERYAAGEIAKFQVRSPFRMATVLVSIEREGVLDSYTVSLSGKNPVLEVPIKAEYGPNVFVSALVVRERLIEVPWYSFFSWGWKAPKQWWAAFRENLAPTATVDLAKPAYKLGIAEIQVGLEAQKLKVLVKPEQTTYPVRGQAKVKVSVADAQGKPLPAGTPIAFAAVDQALLELKDNLSWNILDNMWALRGYGMETFTAQMHVVGKRHYGRKAAPAGGGGGIGPTREIFDTLLLWNPEVLLDAKGEAEVIVPLNDSLTSFKLVAIADHGQGQFGTGYASIQARQDLQIIAGIPATVRSDDQYQAMAMLRNTTNREMKVELQAVIEGGLTNVKFPAQNLTLPAQGSQEVFWPVKLAEFAKPYQEVSSPLIWTLTAKELGTPAAGQILANDRVKITQGLSSATRLAVQSSSLQQISAPITLPIELSAEALSDSGVVQVSVSKTLAGSQTGLRKYFEHYPFACLEQKASKAVALRDAKLWEAMTAQLPLYLDADGLATYFPNASNGKGYDILTSYLLALSHEAKWTIPQDSLEKMQRGLIAFVDGKLTREFWAPSRDLDLRKLSAIEALSRRGLAKPSMLDSIKEDLAVWPTQTLIDYYQISKRLGGLKDREQRMKNTENALRARLTLNGTKFSFNNEQSDNTWWLMGSADFNANRLILAMINEPAWTSDIARLVTGSLARQQKGRWATTTANAWGSLMLEEFSQLFEKIPVTGDSRMEMVDAKPVALTFANPPNPTRLNFSGKASQVKLSHGGTGAPWAQMSVLAAVPRTQPLSLGYQVSKTYSLVQGDKTSAPLATGSAQSFKRGDLVRVKVVVNASSAMTWVAVDDPIPAGAVIQGRGLARDSVIATSGQTSSGAAYPEYQEFGQTAIRTYFSYVPKGEFSYEYTLRLNSVGSFTLPSTRVEAMYAPEVFGELPNAKFTVQ